MHGCRDAGMQGCRLETARLLPADNADAQRHPCILEHVIRTRYIIFFGKYGIFI